MPILELKDVRYSYSPEKVVLRGVNCVFECGTLYALVGKSGAGKSTLLSLMAGLDLFYAFEKLRRDFRQTFCQILMYCGFAYAKFLCRTAYRGSVCRNIFSKQHTSFLFGSIHCSHPIKFFCSNLYAVAYLIIT